METKVVYKPVLKKFMNIADVRVIQVGIKEYVVLKVVFNALGRVEANGKWSDAKHKTFQFLNDIGKIEDGEKLPVLVKQGRTKTTQEVECLNIETVPMLLTQFRPIASNRRTLEENNKALEKWQEFMRFVNNLLLEHEAYKVIFKDKEEQKHIGYVVTQDMDKSMVIVNTHVAIIMAKLIGVYDQGIKKITKDELKIYQPRVTIDLIEVRQEALKLYQEFLLAFDDYKMAIDGVLNCLKRKYRL